MTVPAAQPDRSFPALRRLAALTPLGDEATAALRRAAADARPIRARREILCEGRPITAPLLLLDGWAAQVRILPDGRRQLIGLVLPGEIMGHCGFAGPVASATTVALTDVRTCVLPDTAGLPDLGRAYAISRAMDETHLMAQVVRLGRLDARERILDLLLELHERLALSGVASGNGFTMPLTQEMFADALGLTSVHVNRTLQQSRRSGELEWSGRHVTLPDRAALRAQVGRARTVVASR